MARVRRYSLKVSTQNEPDPKVAACVQRLTELAAELRKLEAQGLCRVLFETASKVDPYVCAEIVRKFFADQGATDKGLRMAYNVMYTIFVFGHTGPAGKRVRFYCAPAKHIHNRCSCNDKDQGAAFIENREITWQRVTASAYWCISREDLLVMSDNQIARIPADHRTKQRIMQFITWLRANPEAS